MQLCCWCNKQFSSRSVGSRVTPRPHRRPLRQSLQGPRRCQRRPARPGRPAGPAAAAPTALPCQAAAAPCTRTGSAVANLSGGALVQALLCVPSVGLGGCHAATKSCCSGNCSHSNGWSSTPLQRPRPRAWPPGGHARWAEQAATRRASAPRILPAHVTQLSLEVQREATLT